MCVTINSSKYIFLIHQDFFDSSGFFFDSSGSKIYYVPDIGIKALDIKIICYKYYFRLFPWSKSSVTRNQWTSSM